MPPRWLRPFAAQHQRAEDCNNDQQARHFKREGEAMEECHAEGLRIALVKCDGLAQAIRAAGPGAGINHSPRKQQVAERRDQHKAEYHSHPALPGYAIRLLGILRLRREHGDDKQEKHHDRARVNQNLHNSDKHRAELQVKQRQEQQRQNQAQRAIHGVSKGNNANASRDSGDRQDKERDNRKIDHSCPSSRSNLRRSSSCSSLTNKTSGSASILPRPTAAALASCPSKTCVRCGTGWVASSGTGSNHTAAEPTVA